MTVIHIATGNALATLQLVAGDCRVALHLHNLPTRAVAVDPLRPELVYCGTFGEGVWCSADAGRSWRRAGEGITQPKLLSIAASRTERFNGSGIVYTGSEPSRVFRSEDAGRSWTECRGLTDLPSAGEWSFPPRPQTHHVRWIEPSPHQAGQLYVAIEAGALVRTPDGGKQWHDRVAQGPRDTHRLATHLDAPGRLYSAAGDGYFESRDGGETWQKLEDGLQHRYVWSVAVDAGDPESILIAAASGPRQSHDLDRAESFLYRRAADTSWQPVEAGLPNSSGRRSAVLAAHPGEAGVFFAAWEDELYHSADGGASWQRLPLAWPEGFHVKRPHAIVATEA